MAAQGLEAALPRARAATRAALCRLHHGAPAVRQQHCGAERRALVLGVHDARRRSVAAHQRRAHLHEPDRLHARRRARVCAHAPRLVRPRALPAPVGRRLPRGAGLERRRAAAARVPAPLARRALLGDATPAQRRDGQRRQARVDREARGDRAVLRRRRGRAGRDGRGARDRRDAARLVRLRPRRRAAAVGRADGRAARHGQDAARARDGGAGARAVLLLLGLRLCGAVHRARRGADARALQGGDRGGAVHHLRR